MKNLLPLLAWSALCVPTVASAQSFTSAYPEAPQAMKRFKALADKQAARQHANKTTEATAKPITKWRTTDLNNNTKTDSSLLAYSGGRGSDFNWETLQFDILEATGPIHFDSAVNANIVNNMAFMVRKNYDAHNNPVLTVTLNAAPLTGAFMNSAKSEMTYDAQNNLLSEIRYSGGANWQLSDKFTYKYDAQNKTIADSSYTYNTGASSWELSDLTTYEYDANGNMVKGNYKEWDGAAWVDVGTIIALYDVQNRRLSGTVYNFGTTNIQYQDSLQYNATGGITYYQVGSAQSGAFAPVFRQFRYPNPAGKPDSVFLDGYNAGNWIKLYRLTFDFNTDGDPTSLKQYEYTGNGYSPDASVNQEYFYGTSWPVGLQQVAVAQNEFTLFPNPAQSNITLQYKGTGAYNTTTVQVGSMDGKVMYQGTADASGKTSINLDRFTTGLYWIAVRDAKGVLLYKSMFNKQ